MKIKWFGDRTKAFSQRLFSSETTPRQKMFDLIFGVVGPVLCLVFDPVIFKSSPSMGLGPMFGQYAFPAYLAIGLGTLTLAVWLLKPPETNFLVGFSAGVMTVGWVLSFLLGLAMLPFTLLGLFVIVGIFGFTPFLTSLAYFRNGVRALRMARAQVNRSLLTAAIIWSIVLSMLLPMVVFWQTNRYVSANVEVIIYGDPNQVFQAAKKLSYALWCSRTCYDDLVQAYNREQDPSRHELLKNVYFQLTGEDITDQSSWLLD